MTKTNPAPEWLLCWLDCHVEGNYALGTTETLDDNGSLSIPFTYLEAVGHKLKTTSSFIVKNLNYDTGLSPNFTAEGVPSGNLMASVMNSDDSLIESSISKSLIARVWLIS